MITPSDVGQIHHISRLAFLAMAARAVSATEFESSPEIQKVVFTVSRGTGGELPMDAEFFGSHEMPLGGMGL
jgi:hypothetical protein